MSKMEACRKQRGEISFKREEGGGRLNQMDVIGLKKGRSTRIRFLIKDQLIIIMQMSFIKE